MKINPKVLIAAVSFFVLIFLYYGIRQIFRIQNDPREKKVIPYEDSVARQAREKNASDSR